METMNKNKWVFNVLKYTGYVILGILGAAALALIFGYVVMSLWNWLMPELFGLTTLTFWQAVGVVVLARLIFGGFKHNPHHPKSRKSYKRKSRFMQKCNDLEHNNSCSSWKYYDDYWKEEGNEAFETYVQKKKEANDQVSE